MSESGENSGGLNHDAGSLTHNNASDLPSQVSNQERGMQSPDRAPDAAQSFEEHAQSRQPVSLVKDYETFKNERQGHAPAAQLDMQADLPHIETVDRAKFQYMQNQEDWATTKGQRRMTEYEYQNPPPKAEPMAKEDFERARSPSNQTRHVTRGRER